MKKALELFGQRLPENGRSILTNHAGKQTFRRDIREQVVQVLTTNTLANTFYVGRGRLTQETVRVLGSMRDLNPWFLAKATVHAREDCFMQLVPTVSLAILSTAADKQPFIAAFPRVIRTPDNLMEFVAVCRSKRIREGLGGIALEQTKNWLNNLSEYHAVKYSGDAAGISLRDCIRMAHPKPKDTVVRERLGWLVSGWKEIGSEPSPTNPRIWQLERLKRATTEAEFLASIADGGLPWECVVPAAKKMSKDVWQELMRQMPYMALLRHLATLTRAGVFETQENVRHVVDRLTDEKAIAKAKILPFRFYAAWARITQDTRHEKDLADALEIALEASFVNLPDLPGIIAIGPDVSGSMSCCNATDKPHGKRRHGHTTFPAFEEPKVGNRAIDICGIFTAALVKKAEEQQTIALPFEHYVHTDVKFKRTDSMLSTTNRIARIGGGGTAVGAPIQHLLDNKIKVDAFVGITDNEDWCYDDQSYSQKYRKTGASMIRGPFLNLWREYKREVAPEAKAFLLTVSPYRDAVVPPSEPDVYFVYGWSQNVPRYISLMLQGKESQIDAVRAIKL